MMTQFLHARQRAWRFLVPIASLVTMFIFAQVAQACSPHINLVLICNWNTTKSFVVYDDDDLTSYLAACENAPDLFQSAFSQIESLIFQDDIFVVAIAPNTPVYDEMIDDHMFEDDCYEVHTVEASTYIIRYVQRQPYCVRAIVLFCPSYTIAPWQKIKFDFRQGNLWAMAGLALSTTVGAILGIHQSRRLLANGQQSLFFVTTWRHVMLRLFQLLLVLILFIVVAYGMIFVATPVLNWLFFPSVFEFILRAFFFSALGMFALHQAGTGLFGVDSVR